MIAELAALGQARAARAWLEAEIERREAPHKAAAEAAGAYHRRLLAEAKAREEAANDAARKAYGEATEARRAALLEGHETPPIVLPDGWTAQARPSVEIFAADNVPRSLCTPDRKAVAEALKAGAVPGARVSTLIVFVRKDPK